MSHDLCRLIVCVCVCYVIIFISICNHDCVIMTSSIVSCFGLTFDLDELLNYDLCLACLSQLSLSLSLAAGFFQSSHLFFVLSILWGCSAGDVACLATSLTELAAGYWRDDL